MSMPRFWWSLKHSEYRAVAAQQRPYDDAVELGDVGALRAEMIGEVREVEEERNEQEQRALAAERERDALRAELAAVLAGYDRDESSPWDVVDILRDIVKRKEDES